MYIKKTANLSVLVVLIFVAVIFIAGVYISAEIKSFYSVKDLVGRLMSWAPRSAPMPAVDSFMDCIRAGYPVQESYPPRCQTPDGRYFIGELGNAAAKTDFIRLNYPRPYQSISSPLIIRGEARGTWFFEASFPVTLVDWDGRIIAESFVMAQGEWMTNDFVPFEGTIDFASPATAYNNGSLILRKDNPSGLPEYDDALEVPIIFQ